MYLIACNASLRIDLSLTDTKVKGVLGITSLVGTGEALGDEVPGGDVTGCINYIIRNCLHDNVLGILDGGDAQLSCYLGKGDP